MHPLKIISLLSWLGLLASQLYLLLPANEVHYYWVIAAALPLLIPIKGLLFDRRYTYRWVGFMTMVYFCIGISELVVHPQLRVYGLATTLSSMFLFLASIYYARYLGPQPRD